MKKIQKTVILPLILIFSASFTGCTLYAGEKQVYFYERPAVGFTVEEEIVTKIDLQDQTSLSINVKDGIIRLIPYEGDTLQITEKRKFTGPATKKALKELLEEQKLVIDNDQVEIGLKYKPKDKLKPFYRFINDIELKVPDVFTNIDIAAESGGIETNGLKSANIIDLKVNKGNIRAERCKANMMYVNTKNGDTDILDYTGNGSFKSGRGNIRLQDLKGNITLSSLLGDTLIKGAEGRLECDISTGSMEVEDSYIYKDSVLYASSGKITADLSNVDKDGKYSIKTSNGDIRLVLSKAAGWSIIAESTKGRIAWDGDLADAGLKISPTGEVYGDVHGGGPYIDVYTDMGNIHLD